MKLIAFILLFIAVSATFIPCCDFDNCPEEMAQSTDEKKAGEGGACSPFSTCSTCSGAVLAIRNVPVSNDFLAKTRFADLAANTYHPGFPSNCWQPPRLG